MFECDILVSGDISSMDYIYNTLTSSTFIVTVTKCAKVFSGDKPGRESVEIKCDQNVSVHLMITIQKVISNVLGSI
jgi:hypothetical protein